MNRERLFGVDFAETIEAFGKICEGEFDHVPEQAFYNVGGLDDVMQQWEQIKKRTGGK